MVSFLDADGNNWEANFGPVKGIPDAFLGPFNVGKLAKEILTGKDIAIVQSAGSSSAAPKNVRTYVPEGEPRKLVYSNPSTSMDGIANDFGGKFDKITIEGLSGSILIRKNEPVSVVLAKMHFEAGPTGPAPRFESQGPSLPRFAIPNTPTIDGGQLRNWNYLFDILVNGEMHTLKVRQSSIALRSINLPMPLAITGPTEQLVFAAPKNGLTLTARSGEDAVTGTIEALLILQDSP